MFRTTTFRANPGLKVLITDIKRTPDGPPVTLTPDDGDMDLRKCANVNPYLIPDSSEIYYAVEHGWLVPIAMADDFSYLLNDTSDAPSEVAKRRAGSALHRTVHAPGAWVLPQPPAENVGPTPEVLTPPPVSTVPPTSASDTTIREAVEAGAFKTVATRMPLSGEEATVVVGDPMKVIAQQRNSVVINPKIRNLFLRFKGMRPEWVDAFGKAGIGHPRELVRYSPMQLLGILGIANTTNNEDLVISWTEQAATILEQLPTETQKTSPR